MAIPPSHLNYGQLNYEDEFKKAINTEEYKKQVNLTHRSPEVQYLLNGISETLDKHLLNFMEYQERKISKILEQTQLQLQLLIELVKNDKHI